MSRDHTHHWVPKARGKGERCTSCSATFPCKDECPHLDCEEARGRAPKCPVCHKVIPEDERFHVMQHAKSVAVHVGCAPVESQESVSL